VGSQEAVAFYASHDLEGASRLAGHLEYGTDREVAIEVPSYLKPNSRWVLLEQVVHVFGTDG
jgi:hypothetical protein